MLQAPTVDATNGESMTKGVTFNKGSLDVMLNLMQKQGKGEVISQPKVTTSDKEQAALGARFPYRGYVCETPVPHRSEPYRPYNYHLSIKPEIMNDEKIKLHVEFTFFDNVNNTQQSKAFTKIVDDEQLILLDELIMPIPDKKDRLLLVFISPRIIMYGLHRDVIAIKYGDANKIITTFTKQYLTGAKNEGSITVEEKTNIILANLTEKNLKKLRQLVVKIDVPATRMP